MKKLLASDFDGTLFRDELSAKRNITKINEFRDKGNLFVIATGRSYQRLMKRIKQYHINYDYLIYDHGSVILDKNNNVIKNFTINIDVVNEILNYVKQNNKIEQLYVESIFETSYQLDIKPITKILIELKKKDESLKLVNELKTKFSNDVKIYLLFDCYIEIIPKETDKAEALKIVVERENLNNNQIYVIGDDHNDLEMIEAFSGYGMLNSVDEVKKISKKLYVNVSDLVDDIFNK